MPSWGPGVHCWTPSPEHGARHVVGMPKKKFGEGVNECPNLVSPLVFVSLTTPTRFIPASLWQNWCQLPDLICLHLFISLPLPSVNTDCARVSIEDETIRINGSVLAHSIVDSQTWRIPFKPDEAAWAGHTWLCQCRGGNAPNSLIFLGRKAFFHYQNKIKKALFWLVELVQYLVLELFPFNIFPAYCRQIMFEVEYSKIKTSHDGISEHINNFS